MATTENSGERLERHVLRVAGSYLVTRPMTLTEALRECGDFYAAGLDARVVASGAGAPSLVQQQGALR